MSSREIFLEQMESQLNVWHTQLAQISRKSENMDQAKRKKIEEEYSGLQLQIRDFRDHMSIIGNANADTWHELKAEVERLGNEVREAIGRIAMAVNGKY